MNVCYLIGNVVSKDFRYSKGEEPIAICTIRLAVNNNRGKDKPASFHNVKVFGRQAETCEQYIEKGYKICVTGSLQNYEYEMEDGTKRRGDEIIAERIEFLWSQNND